MLRYSQDRARARGSRCCIHHDDAEREFAYDREFRLSPLAEALDKADDYGITVVSMKRDWKTVFRRWHNGVDGDAQGRRMKEWLIIATRARDRPDRLRWRWSSSIGTVEAFFGGLRADARHRRPVTRGATSGCATRAGWLPALTFQLAADIIETSITHDWEAIGRIAAIAVIRTFLNYFLERDLAEMRERQHEAAAQERRNEELMMQSPHAACSCTRRRPWRSAAARSARAQTIRSAAVLERRRGRRGRSPTSSRA